MKKYIIKKKKAQGLDHLYLLAGSLILPSWHIKLFQRCLRIVQSVPRKYLQTQFSFIVYELFLRSLWEEECEKTILNE